jgi:hypothetical protein
MNRRCDTTRFLIALVFLFSTFSKGESAGLEPPAFSIFSAPSQYLSTFSAPLSIIWCSSVALTPLKNTLAMDLKLIVGNRNRRDAQNELICKRLKPSLLKNIKIQSKRIKNKYLQFLSKSSF